MRRSLVPVYVFAVLLVGYALALPAHAASSQKSQKQEEKMKAAPSGQSASPAPVRRAPQPSASTPLLGHPTTPPPK